MGAISFSLDVDLARLMQRELRSTIFFESGGFEGDTIARVEGLFERVISVEVAPSYAQGLRSRFAHSKSVEIIEGDSAAALEKLKPELAAAHTLYWLDAHWCDANAVDAAIHQCPLLRELSVLGPLNKHSAVIIDDARLFLAPPLAPHEVSDWPTWSQISRAVEASSGATHDIMVVNDCIVVFPRTMRSKMVAYAQTSGVDWLKIADLSREHATMQAAAEDRLRLINELHGAAAQANQAVNESNERLGLAHNQLSEKQSALAELHSDLEAKQVALTAMHQTAAKAHVENRSLTESLNALRNDLEAKQVALTALQQTAAKAHAESRALTERLYVMQNELEAKESVIQGMAEASSQVDERMRALVTQHETAKAGLVAKEEVIFALEQRRLEQERQLADAADKAQAFAQKIHGLRSAELQREDALASLNTAFAAQNHEIQLQERQLADASDKAQAFEQKIHELRSAELHREEALASLNTTIAAQNHEMQSIREQINQLREEDLARRQAAADHIAACEQALRAQITASQDQHLSKYRSMAAEVASLQVELHHERVSVAALRAENEVRSGVMSMAAGAMDSESPTDATVLGPEARLLLEGSVKKWQREATEKEAVIRELATAIDAHRAALARPPRLHKRAWQQVKGSVNRAIQPKLGVLYQHPPVPLGERRIAVSRPAAEQDCPTISIVTPSFRQAHLIERTLKSVVEQGYPKLDYHVQDGGSTDGTVAVLERWQDRLTSWESVPDGGQSAAINLGFAKTNGEIMAWLNSDDVLMPGALDYVASFFHRNPQIDVLYGNRLLIDEDDALIGRWVLPGHDDKVLPWADYVPQETLFWRRSIWEKVGGIDESFKFAMDWDLLLRFRAAGARFAHRPVYLGAFRIHAKQKTSAAINEIGFQEMNRLRRREFGRDVTHDEIRRAIAPFMARHLVADKLARFK